MTFADALAVLAKRKVEFIVVGGLAVARAGYPRFTEDLDLLVEASESNLTTLIDVLSTFGEGAAAELTPADFPLEEGCVRIVEDFPIDIFTLMSSQTFADLEPLSQTHEVEGEPVRFLSAEGLIRLKADSLRPKDQLDVQVLRDILSQKGSS